MWYYWVKTLTPEQRFSWKNIQDQVRIHFNILLVLFEYFFSAHIFPIRLQGCQTIGFTLPLQLLHLNMRNSNNFHWSRIPPYHLKYFYFFLKNTIHLQFEFLFSLFHFLNIYFLSIFVLFKKSNLYSSVYVL